MSKYLLDGIAETTGDALADISSKGAGSQGELTDYSFQPDAGNVSQLLFLGHHIAAQSIHDGLHLILLYLVYKRAKAVT